MSNTNESTTETKSLPVDPPGKANYGFDHFVERRSGNVPQSFWKRLFFVESSQTRQRKECQVAVVNAVKRNPMIKLLIEALQSAGCPVDLHRHVSCEVCSGPVAGGYDQEYNQIVLCQNKTQRNSQIEGSLAHELIHMFDHCVNDVNFNNIEHIACSEVRAANLAHCGYMNAVLDGLTSFYNIKQAHQECVKYRAAKSLVVVRNITLEEALEVVNKVFIKCYNDLEPIGRRPRPGSDDLYRAYVDGYYYGYRQKKPYELDDDFW